MQLKRTGHINFIMFQILNYWNGRPYRAEENECSQLQIASPFPTLDTILGKLSNNMKESFDMASLWKWDAAHWA